MWIPRIKPITKKRLEQLVRDHGSEDYQKWRKEVLDRDDHQCQWPGCNRKIKLEIHHIKRFTDAKHLKHEVWNGICLCKLHHRSISQKEKSYELFFLKLALANQQKRDKNE